MYPIYQSISMGDMKAPSEAPLSVDKFRYHGILLHNIRYAAQRLSAIRLTKLLLNKQASIAVATAPGRSRGNMLLHSTSITKRGLWAEVRQLVATPGICPACQTALRSREVTLTWGRVPLLWNSGTKLARRGCSDRAAPSCSIPIDPPHLLSRLHIIVSLWFGFFFLFVFFQWLHCCCVSSATILNLFLEHQGDCHMFDWKFSLPVKSLDQTGFYFLCEYTLTTSNIYVDLCGKGKPRSIP